MLTLQYGDAKFVGSATVMEAKQKIYKECLGFKDFKTITVYIIGYISFLIHLHGMQ